MVKAGRKDGGFRSGKPPPEGAMTRAIGQRVVVQRPDEVVIAETSEWLLVEVTGWSRPPWVSCKVLAKLVARKNVFHVGVRVDQRAHNRTRDSQVLDQRYPGVLDWVIDEVVGYVKEKL